MGMMWYVSLACIGTLPCHVCAVKGLQRENAMAVSMNLAKRRPPGPRQHWLGGNHREFSRDRLGALARWHQQYGDMVWARFGPRSVLFLHHPELVEEVLVAQSRKFIKHYWLRA